MIRVLSGLALTRRCHGYPSASSIITALICGHGRPVAPWLLKTVAEQGRRALWWAGIPMPARYKQMRLFVHSWSIRGRFVSPNRNRVDNYISSLQIEARSLHHPRNAAGFAVIACKFSPGGIQTGHGLARRQRMFVLSGLIRGPDLCQAEHLRISLPCRTGSTSLCNFMLHL